MSVAYSVVEHVATIALDDPDTRNALSNEMLDGLIEAFEIARDDEAVRVCVLASTHATTFSSGGNLAGFAADVPLVHKHLASSRFPELFRLIGTLGKPTICAAGGHCLAGALGPGAGLRSDRRRATRPRSGRRRSTSGSSRS